LDISQNGNDLDTHRTHPDKVAIGAEGAVTVKHGAEPHERHYQERKQKVVPKLPLREALRVMVFVIGDDSA
jgi:hypothetical protein